ncbi:hypothetical protein ONZ51_g7815 [Trametes cubensis]|uniref:CCHC-type domain-containing protein n=1 Tax=Trametes cubensis TaxID=1111947 RepID=A0AAD7TRH1_9APHY|nr:hypothetical protein ONZ51_g7815 [Trametes cubensis]
MHSLRKGKALKERDTGLYQVDQPLGQRQSLEELSILLEVEEEADQVGLEVGLTLSLQIPTSQEEDHWDHWDHRDQTQTQTRKELQEMRCKDKGKARSRTLRSSMETKTKPVDEVDDSMVNLTTIQLKDYSSVDEFNARFMDLALKGKVLDPAAQLALYRNALLEYLLKKISMLYPLPTTIEEWMTRTKEIDHSYHLTEKILANRRGRKAKTSKTRKNVKMVNVEDDSLDINKLSIKERQELQDKGLCFRCRKLGHISRDCPSKPKKPSKPVSRKVQQVTDEDLEDESEEISDEEDDKDEEDNISINALRATDFETGF